MIATRRDSVGLLITLVAIAASAALAVSAPAGLATIFDNPRDFVFLLVLTLALQLFSSSIYGSGGEGVSAAGMLAAAFVLGAAPAMAIAIVAAVLQWIRRRGLLHRAIFDASDFALATGAAAAVFAVADHATDSTPVLLAAAAAAGVVYKIVNTGLLCIAMALSESLRVREVWRERFRWARFHYLALGPVAFAAVVAYERMGVLGLAAFSVPPVLMMLSVREYLERTRESVENVRRANEELRRSNAELAARNDDLRELLVFAGGLAAHAHDRRELTAYAEEALGRLVGARATIADEADPGSHGIAIGPTAIAHLRLDRGARFDGDRWNRLRDALVPQLATALESRFSSSASARPISRRSPRSRGAWKQRTAAPRRTPSGWRRSQSASPASSATSAPTSTRSRWARSCTTSARSGFRSRSSTSPARSTTRSGR